MNSSKQNNWAYRSRQGVVITASVLAVLLMTAPALGMSKIRDVARPLGERNNKLWGLSLVVGLNGTGDGGDMLPMARPLLTMLQNMGNPPTTVEELKDVKNVAVVAVSAELDRNGTANGDKIDVVGSSLGKAKSLAGGVLIPAPLRSLNRMDDSIYAWAEGEISLPDPKHGTAGMIKGGAVMEFDLVHNYVEYDEAAGVHRFDLILDEDQANFQSARKIAMAIDTMNTVPGAELAENFDEAAMAAQRTAFAITPRMVRVIVPRTQAQHPADYIARVLELNVELPNPEATIAINEKTGTIAITGNVEIAACTVHVDGLLIRIVDPEPKGQPGQPVVSQTQWSKFGNEEDERSNIEDLIDALDQLNVPVREKINAIYALRDAGVLRARIKTE